MVQHSGTQAMGGSLNVLTRGKALADGLVMKALLLTSIGYALLH